MSEPNNNIHWRAGSVNVVEALKAVSVDDHPGVLLHMDTPYIPASIRPHPFSSFDAFDEALFEAWQVALAQLPETVIGQRQSLQTFLFLLPGPKDRAMTQAIHVLDALQRDDNLSLLVWRLVLSPVTHPWDHAVMLAEWVGLDGPAPTEQSVVLWVEGDLTSPRITTLTSGAPQEVGGRV